MLTQEEMKRFDTLFEEVLEPFFKENQERIDSYLESNPTLNNEVKEELKSLNK